MKNRNLLRRLFVASITMVVLLAAPVGAALAGSFVYALDQVNGSPNQVYGFRLNESTGALTSLLRQPVNTLGASGKITGVQFVAARAALVPVINLLLDDSGSGANQSPDVVAQFPSTVIQAGQEIVYCYYFHFASMQDVMLKSWQSSFSPGVFSVEVFSTNTDAQPPGTVSASQCGIASANLNNFPMLIYSSRTAQDGWSLPSNDGTGKPVGKLIKAGQPMFLRVHALNATNASIQAQAQVSVTGYPAGTVVTQADSFMAFNGNISIPPNAIGDTETQTCSLPSGMQFTRLSIYTHKQGVHSYVRDGIGVNGAIVVDSPDWTQPTTVVWSASPFGTFTTGKFTYHCVYDNTGPNFNRTITSGDSVQTDEICEAFGYFFPATKPALCYNGFVIP